MESRSEKKLWQLSGEGERHVALCHVLEGYKKVGHAFIMSELVTDLYSEGIIITSEQCRDLLFILGERGIIDNASEYQHRVI